MSIQAIKGVKDVLPSDAPAWQYLEATARKLFEDYGFAEIRVPVFEYTELFARSIGASTDIVEKEMYTFEDRDGRKITLISHVYGKSDNLQFILFLKPSDSY